MHALIPLALFAPVAWCIWWHFKVWAPAQEKRRRADIQYEVAPHIAQQEQTALRRCER